tara:strand:- start:1014 stop:1277 length:264 start_codon:yes stop_codon:yes gene_type:complete
MNYYVTDTEAEAQAHEDSDFLEFKAANTSLPAQYWAVTTAWSNPIQRLDGKWIRAACPDSTATERTIEAHDISWFPRPYEDETEYNK